MSFEKVAGQGRAKSQIRAWFDSGRFPHSILIAGLPGSGKRRLALELAKAIQCADAPKDSCDSCSSCKRCDELTHPDLHVLLPITAPRGNSADSGSQEAVRLNTLEYLRDLGVSTDSSTNIARDDLRALQSEMIYAPTASPRRVAILFDADRMHPAGANSLLKVLEEPPRNAVFILVSTYPERILPTILSRCQQLPVERLADEEIRTALADSGIETGQLERAVRMAGGNLQRAHQIAGGEFDEIQTRVEEFLLAGVNSDDEVYWSVADEFGGRGARLQLERFLEGCHDYLRDLLLMHSGDEPQLTFSDRQQVLERLGPGWDVDKLENAAAEVDRAFDNVRRNVNANLLLADLWRRLSQSPRPSMGATRARKSE